MNLDSPRGPVLAGKIADLCRKKMLRFNILRIAARVDIAGVASSILATPTIFPNQVMIQTSK
jgi:hypothetical protein